MSFALRENKVAVTEEKCVEEHISLASLVKQVYYRICTIQARSTRKTQTALGVAVFTI